MHLAVVEVLAVEDSTAMVGVAALDQGLLRLAPECA